MQNIEAFKTLIDSSPKKIVITTHHKPDADALGSSLGLAEFLRKKGHHPSVITPTDYPDFLSWMHGNDDVVIYNHGQEEKTASLIAEAEIIFCLDFSSLKRINEVGDLVREASCVKVLIDHHLEPEDFADFVQWSTKAAATAELIFDLIEEVEEIDLIDEHIADCLYAGIMTDTGNFKHPNVSGHVFEICGQLVKCGANTSRVSKLIYDSNSLDRIKFLGFALNERLKVIPEYNTAYFAISEDDLSRFHSKTGDTEGLVNYALSIKGIRLAAVIIDRTEAIKMSFRSIGDFSVNEFARKHFNGGGHKNAAGGISEDSLDATVQKFEQTLEEYHKVLADTADII